MTSIRISGVVREAETGFGMEGLEVEIREAIFLSMIFLPRRLRTRREPTALIFHLSSKRFFMKGRIYTSSSGSKTEESLPQHAMTFKKMSNTTRKST